MGLALTAAAGWHAAEWAALGTCLTVVVYIVIGVLAWRQISEAKRVRELQTRPYVIVDFEFRRWAVYIAVRNIGTTPARDVQIAFDKPFKTSSARQKDINEASVFKAPIPMLAPGRTIRVMFDVGPRLFAEDLPRSYTATVTYRDHGGKKKYEDPPYVLDLSHFEHAAVDPKGLPELVSAVEKIREEMHRWTDGSHGFLAMVVDRRRFRARSERWIFREDAARVRREDGWIALVRWLYDYLLRLYGWR